MLEWLLIRKANAQRIASILTKEGFEFTEADVAALAQGNQKGVRYGNSVLTRNEVGGQVKRFIKIQLDGAWKTYTPFRRQVRITAALHADTKFLSPTMAVLRSSLTPPVPYAIFETREDGDGFGFMHDTPAFYERFSTEDMVRLVKVLYGFHRSGFDIDPNILTLTRKMSAQLSHYQREFKKLLDTRILHRAADGTETTASVEQLLVRYTGLPDVRTRISLVLEKNFTFVGSSRASKGVYLVHADMQIDNVYRHRDGEFELLDFEWVGRSDNPVVAIMFDYGNLRARAWSSPSFQFTLDTVMVDVGKHIYSGAEDMLRAALILGTLRSSLLMSRFHLDFKNTVKKDKRSEEEYFAMYPSTVAALARVLV